MAGKRRWSPGHADNSKPSKPPSNGTGCLMFIAFVALILAGYVYYLVVVK